MNEMNTNNRDYDNRYDNRGGYDNRYYDEAMYGNRESYRDNYREDYRYDNRYDNRADYRGNYRENYRDDYREDYREDYRKRDYDRRGGKINNRNYRNYREDYHEELEITMEDMREQYRKLEDIGEMAQNPQEKNMITRIAQKEKENYMALKQMVDKQM